MASKFLIDVDELTLQRLRKRDRNTQQAIFQLYSRPVFFACMKICQNQMFAEDAMQEVFIKVFTKIEQFRCEVPFGIWVRKIAVNHCINLVQSQAFKMSIITNEEPDLQLDTNNNVEQDLIESDLHKLLQKLPKQTRTVLWMYHIEGMTHQEIADIYQKSVSFSKQTVHRAMATLIENGDRTSTSVSQKNTHSQQENINLNHFSNEGN